MKHRAEFMAAIGLALVLGSGCIEVEGSLDVHEPDEDRPGRVILRGKPVVIKKGETVQGDLVVIDGRAAVHGEVRGSLVVVAGSLRVGPTARIRGDLVAVGNEVTEVAPGALVRGSRVTVDWAGVRLMVQNTLLALENPVLTGAIACLGILLLLFLAWRRIIHPYDTERFHRTVEHRPVRAGLLGLLVVIALQTLTVLTFLVPYAIGLLPVLWLALVTLSFVGWIVVAGHVGRVVARRRGWTVGPFLYGLAGIGIACLVFLIPLFGQVASIIASWVGIGALLRPARPDELPAQTPPAVARADAPPDQSQISSD